ncbi:MAG: hypothetical protein WCB12_15065 [Bryobacteraceae bacterium]
MRFATLALLGFLLLGSLAPLNAGEPAGASQVAIGFSGGSTWLPDYSGGTCMWYLPLVAGYTVFNADGSYSPALFYLPGPTNAPSMQNAYLLWVSDFQAQYMDDPSKNKFIRVQAPAGTATIYYSATPLARDLTDPIHNNRTTWGTPVATFVRTAGMLYTTDGFASDTFIFSATLTSFKTFTLNGKQFNFKKLIPNGMTCHEAGLNGSTTEIGNCVAIGGGSTLLLTVQ